MIFCASLRYTNICVVEKIFHMHYYTELFMYVVKYEIHFINRQVQAFLNNMFQQGSLVFGPLKQSNKYLYRN